MFQVVLEDINECEEFEHICQNGHCTNTFGSFICACNEGFRLDGSQSMCVDVNECKENPKLCKYGDCVNEEGSFRCSCPQGYMAMPDGSKYTYLGKQVFSVLLFLVKNSKKLFKKKPECIQYFLALNSNFVLQVLNKYIFLKRIVSICEKKFATWKPMAINVVNRCLKVRQRNCVVVQWVKHGVKNVHRALYREQVKLIFRKNNLELSEFKF